MKTINQSDTEAICTKIQTTLFQNIQTTEKDWDIFRSLIKTVSHNKNEFLLQINEIENNIYCLLEGVVRKYTFKGTKEYTFDFHFPVKFFNSYSSYRQKTPSTIALQALSPALVLQFSRKSMEQLYEQAPNAEKIGRKMIEFAFINAENKDAKINTQSPEDNYLELLNQNPKLVQNISGRHIASYLGITPESLSRIRKRISKS